MAAGEGGHPERRTKGLKGCPGDGGSEKGWTPDKVRWSVCGRKSWTTLRKGSVSDALMESSTADGWRWDSTATSLRERCTAGSRSDGGEVNSLMHKKLNQAVQKAAQSIVLSKSARLNEERISNMRF